MIVRSLLICVLVSAMDTTLINVSTAEIVAQLCHNLLPFIPSWTTSCKLWAKQLSLTMLSDTDRAFSSCCSISSWVSHISGSSTAGVFQTAEPNPVEKAFFMLAALSVRTYLTLSRIPYSPTTTSKNLVLMFSPVWRPNNIRLVSTQSAKRFCNSGWNLRDG